MNQSVTAISIRLAIPPQWPAASPIAVPSSIVSAVAMTPMAREGRVPQINSVSTERPDWSVPSG